MSKIEREAIVAFSCRQMYDLVNNVPAYPEFLPWCKGARVISVDEQRMTGELTIKKGSLEQTFTTENDLQKDESVTMNLLDGPFTHMQGRWQFKALSVDACKVSFSLDFAFKNKLLSLTLGPVFSKIADTMLDAFIQRAEQIYGVDNNEG